MAPVVRVTRLLRSSNASAAVLKSIGTNPFTMSFNLETFASLIPFTSASFLVVACATDSTVWYPVEMDE